MAQFLSADHVQGNGQGMDPYSYVAGNPETATDPTGQRISCPPDCGGTGSNGGGTPCTLGHAGCGSPALTSCDSGFHLASGSCVQDTQGGKHGGDRATVPTTPSPNGGKPKCDTSCQIAKIKNHDYAQEQEVMAWVSFGADVTTLIGLILATIVDWGQPQMWVDFAEIIADGIAAVGDLVSGLGGQVTGLFGFIVSAAKYAVTALDLVRGVFDFVGAIVNPVKGWLKKAVDFFAVAAAKQVKEGLALLIPTAADALFYGASGNVSVYWNNQIQSDQTLSASAAYQTCVADYSVSACS